MRKWISALDALLFTRRSAAKVQIDALDGIRGFAVTLVLVSHLSNAGLHVIPGVSLAGTGRYGVYLFFVLSSFLLSAPLFGRSAEVLCDAREWVVYGMRRIFRVFPLYIVVLTFSFLLAPTGLVVGLSWEEYIGHLLLQEGKNLFWTIPVEFKNYLILPVLPIVSVVVLGKRWPSVVGAFALSIAVADLIAWPSENTYVLSVHLGSYLPLFLFGGLGAFIYSEAAPHCRRFPAFAVWALELGGIAILVVVFALVPGTWSRLTGTPLNGHPFLQPFFLFGFLWTAFLICVLFGRGILRSVFCWKPFRAVGIVSFSVYLWHYPILLWVDAKVDAPGWIKIVVFFAVTAAISILSYRIVEKPFMSVRWEFIRRRRPAAITAAA